MISFEDYFLVEFKITDKVIERLMRKFEMSDDLDGHPVNRNMLIDTLERYEKQLKRGVLKGQHKDIDTFEYYDDLEHAIGDAEDIVTGADKTRIEKEGAIRVFEDENVLVVHVKTHEASVHYGRDTEWCISQKDDPGPFNDYTKKGVVFLFFLPRKGWEAPERNFGQVAMSDNDVDQSLLLYPEAFYWSYDSASKNLGKLIFAYYEQNKPVPPLSEIAKWTPENAIAIAQARANMERTMKNWNMNGVRITEDVIGPEDVPDETPDAHELYKHLEEEGWWGLLSSAWTGHSSNWSGWGRGITAGHSPTPKRDEQQFKYVVSPIVEQLKQGSADIGRSGPVQDRRYTKFCHAIAPHKEVGSSMQDTFGQYASESYDAQDGEMETKRILKMFEVTPQEETKMAQYCGEFHFEKIWTDGKPNAIYEYMEKTANQTPENLERAEEFFITQPLTLGAWRYARSVYGGAQKDIDAANELASLAFYAGDEAAQANRLGRGRRQQGDDWEGTRDALMVTGERRPWKELEDSFIKILKDAVSEERRTKGLKHLIKTWDGVMQVQKQLEDEAGSTVGVDEPTDWVNREYRSWIENHEMPTHSFMTTNDISGLMGYLFHIKNYNWPELEELVADHKYYNVGVMNLGPDWIQWGKRRRWKKYEDALEKVWRYTAANPYVMGKSQQPQGQHPTPWERETQTAAIGDHLQFHGNIETILQLVKATKRQYYHMAGGGSSVNQYEPAARQTHTIQDPSDAVVSEFAPGAWWDDPEIRMLYWGAGAIKKKLTPSQKRRRGRNKYEKAENYHVGKDRIKRPFTDEVEPGAWLKDIPDIFTIQYST